MNERLQTDSSFRERFLPEAVKQQIAEKREEVRQSALEVTPPPPKPGTLLPRPWPLICLVTSPRMHYETAWRFALLPSSEQTHWKMNPKPQVLNLKSETPNLKP